MNYTVVVLGGVLLLSVLYYYAPAPYGGVHWFTGPKITVAGAKDETSERTATVEDVEPTPQKRE
jgi:hypothetical protein